MSSARTPPPGRPAPDAAAALEPVVRCLQEEVEGLRHALRTRGVIEQAKGVLVATAGVTPEEAFDRLRRLSQEQNVRLVDVAAALVGVTAPAQADQLGERPLVAAAQAVADLPRWAEDRQSHPEVSQRARDQLFASAAAMALDGDALAQEILAASADIGVAGVVLYRALADGALELLGGAGFPEDQLSAWRRIPPDVDVPFTAALLSRRPVLLGDREERVRRYPGSRGVASRYQATAAVPVINDGEVLGVVGLAWPHPVDTGDPALTGRSGWVASLALPYLREANDPGNAGQVALMRSVIAVLPDPGMVLEHLDGGAQQPGDFLIERANLAAAHWLGHSPEELAGRRLLAVAPDAAGSGVLEVLAGVARTGGSPALTGHRWIATPSDAADPVRVDLRAARVGRRVLVTWRPSPGTATTSDGAGDPWELLRHEGVWQWDLRRDEITWSAGVYRLLGLATTDGPLSLSRSREMVAGSDRAVVDAALRQLFERGVETSWVARIRRGDGTWARALMRARPEVDEAGTVTCVRGTVLDLGRLQVDLQSALGHQGQAR